MSNVVTKSVLDALRNRELRAKKALKHVLFSLARAYSLSAIKYMSKDRKPSLISTGKKIKNIISRLCLREDMEKISCIVHTWRDVTGREGAIHNFKFS